MQATIDLLRFCSDWREDMSLPFTVGEWTYATNGCFCVRVPSNGSTETDIAQQRFPRSAATHPMWAKEPAEWHPLPDVATLPPVTQCKVCKGGGKAPAYIECKTCDGEGFHLCDCGHQHDCCHCSGEGVVPIECKTCDGEGFHLCDCGHQHDCCHCSGEGVVPIGGSNATCETCTGLGSDSVRWLGKRWETKLLKPLAELPNATGGLADDGCTLIVRFNGGQGLLIAMNEPVAI